MNFSSTIKAYWFNITLIIFRDSIEDNPQEEKYHLYSEM